MSMMIRTGTLVKSKARRKSIAEARRKRRESQDMKAYTNTNSQLTPTSHDTSMSSLSEHHEASQLFQNRRCSSSTDLSGYGTIQQIAEYKDECSGPLDFLNRTVDLVFCTVPAKIALLLLTALPISMLVVGSTYKTDCPKDPKLPLYLLVGGGVGLLKIVFLLWRQRGIQSYERLDEKSDYDDESEDLVLTRFVRFTNLTLSLFIVVWFGFGNYWFYSLWEPKFEQPLHEPNNWCHRILFWYFFYHLIASYVMYIFICVFIVIVLCYYGNKDCCSNSSGVV